MLFRSILEVNQNDYLMDSLERYGMTQCRPSDIVLPSNVKLTKPPEEYRATDNLRQEYQSKIGTLLYLSLGTRPDVHFAVTRLSRYNANPTQDHLNAVDHIFRYLNGSRSKTIRYNGKSNSGLIGYTDADWGADLDDRHSTSGFIFFMADGPVSWKSQRQKTVALSSTEAEYMAMSEACRQVIWHRIIIDEFGYGLDQPTPIAADNQGAIYISNNPVHDRRTKHIDIRYNFIKEAIENGEIEVFFVRTNNQLADIMTKALPAKRHMDLVQKIGLI